jgi:hypothetical protein
MNYPFDRDVVLSGLDVAERTFIWGFRSLAHRQRLSSPTQADLQEVYEYFHVGDSVPSLETPRSSGFSAAAGLPTFYFFRLAASGFRNTRRS